MLLYAYICYLIVGVVWTLNNVKREDCDNMGTILYDDLGCSPLYESFEPCPTKYHCDFFSGNNTCIFRGNSYNISQEIEDNLLTENCFSNCTCANPSGLDKYQCAVMNCTEWSQHYNHTKCYKTYEVNDCCSTGIKCPAEEEDHFECLFEGTIYREGELFIPNNTCTKCSCQKGFKGKVEEPYCKRSLCATQFTSLQELENFCAPLYLPEPGQNALCCPNDWVCYSDSDIIKKINPNRDPTLEIFCTFGPKLLERGQGITRLFNYFGMDLHVTCECILPPLLTCTQN